MNGNGKVNFPDRFHGSPEGQQPRETGRAYHWFLKYLNMNNRKIQTVINYAAEQRALQKEENVKGVDGFFPASNTVHSWAKKYKWNPRADAWDARLREQAMLKMTEDRAENLEDFLKNDLEIVMDIQTQVKEYIAQCKLMDNQTERVHVLFKLTKTYGDARKWAQELLKDAIDEAKGEETEEEETTEVDFEGVNESETEYQEAAG